MTDWTNYWIEFKISPVVGEKLNISTILSYYCVNKENTTFKKWQGKLQSQTTWGIPTTPTKVAIQQEEKTTDNKTKGVAMDLDWVTEKETEKGKEKDLLEDLQRDQS